jgi:hypothetical protein
VKQGFPPIPRRGFFYDKVVGFARTLSSFSCHTFSLFPIQINKKPVYSANMAVELALPSGADQERVKGEWNVYHQGS